MIGIHATRAVACGFNFVRMESLPMTDETGLTTARQFAMLQSIPRNPLKATTAEIETRLRDEGFEVSRRTIERDLHALSARFPLQLDDRAKPYGWSWAKDAGFSFMPRLNASQAVALLLARTHLRDLLPQSMNKELFPIFDAAAQVLAHSGWKDWHKRTAVVPMGIAHVPPKLSNGILPMVQSALAHRHCIAAHYRAKGAKEAKSRKIHPLGLMSRGPVLYLICTLFDYDDVLQLPLHRLSNATETGEPAKEPAGFDFRQWVDTHGRRYNSNGPIRLVARFDAGAAEHLREMPLSQDQAWRDLEDGEVEISATVEDDELLHWWLLGFGSFVEVVKPAKLRKALYDNHAKSVKIYEKQTNERI